MAAAAATAASSSSLSLVVSMADSITSMAMARQVSSELL